MSRPIRDLEGAIRDHLTADKVKNIIQAIYESAVGRKIGDKYFPPNVKAAKLLLDKLIPNATDAADVGETGRVVVFRIENATFAAQQLEHDKPPPLNPPIDAAYSVSESGPISPVVEVVEVKQESNGKA